LTRRQQKSTYVREAQRYISPNKRTCQEPDMKTQAIVPLNNHNQTICKPWVAIGGIFIMLVKYILENTLLASGRFHYFSHNKYKWTKIKNTILKEDKVS
jgi:hypothetical protein